MLIKRRHIRFASYHSRGLAISLILLAVVLLAAIGVALAIGSRSGFSGTSNQKAKVLANIILSQAAKVEAGYNNMRVVNGWGTGISAPRSYLTRPTRDPWKSR